MTHYAVQSRIGKVPQPGEEINVCHARAQVGDNVTIIANNKPVAWGLVIEDGLTGYVNPRTGTELGAGFVKVRIE